MSGAGLTQPRACGTHSVGFREEMSNILGKDLHLFIGKLVRVVYIKDRGIQGLNVVVDHLITPPVLLRGYDPTTQTVTIERPGGTLEAFEQPAEVLSA